MTPPTVPSPLIVCAPCLCDPTLHTLCLIPPQPPPAVRHLRLPTPRLPPAFPQPTRSPPSAESLPTLCLSAQFVQADIDHLPSSSTASAPLSAPQAGYGIDQELYDYLRACIQGLEEMLKPLEADQEHTGTLPPYDDRPKRRAEGGLAGMRVRLALDKAALSLPTAAHPQPTHTQPARSPPSANPQPTLSLPSPYPHPGLRRVETSRKWVRHRRLPSWCPPSRRPAALTLLSAYPHSAHSQPTASPQPTLTIPSPWPQKGDGTGREILDALRALQRDPRLLQDDRNKQLVEDVQAKLPWRRQVRLALN